LAAKPLPADQAFQFSATAKDNQTVLLSWKIAPNYYLYKKDFAFHPIKSPDAILGNPLYPSDTRSLKTVTGIEAVYANNVTIPIPLVQSNQQHIILQVKYQGCSKAGYCYPPVSKVVSINLSGNYLQPTYGLNIDVAPATKTTETPSHTNAFLFLLSFLGFGILLSLTPCVLPMIPILFSMIKGHDKSHAHAFFISVSYVLGMSLMYALAGILFGIIGQNIQITFQKPAVIIAFSLLFILMALSEFGLFNIQLPEKWRSKIDRISHHQKRGTLIGAFIMGCLSTLILSPCVTPPLVAALSYISHTGNATLGGAALFIMGIGMGAPLLLIGIAGPKILPKSGKWMTVVKNVTGGLLLVVAALMLQRLIPTTIQPEKAALNFQTVHSISAVETTLKTEAAKKQIVLLDFSADWCMSCKELDATTFKNPAVIAQLSHYILLRADVTEDSADEQLLMQHFNIVGTPTLLFFKNQQELSKTRIVGYVSSKKLLDHIKRNALIQ
jgi:thiol:disulfide interchange protein DsbD